MHYSYKDVPVTLIREEKKAGVAGNQGFDATYISGLPGTRLQHGSTTWQNTQERIERIVVGWAVRSSVVRALATQASDLGWILSDSCLFFLPH